MVDGSRAGERDGQQIVHPDPRGSRHLDGTTGVHGWVDVRVDVAAQTPGLVCPHGASNLVRGVAERIAVAPGTLVRHVVGHLVLEHHGPAALASPDHLVLLVVLDEQAGRGDVVPVDHDTRGGSVEGPPDARPVVRSPGPDVIEDDVVAVDHQADRGLADVRPADSEEHVLQRGGVVRVAPAVPSVVGTHPEQDRRNDRSGVEDETGDVHPRDVGDAHRHDPVPRGQGGQAQAEDHRVGPLDLDGLVDVVDAGSQNEVLPQRQLAVDRRDPVRGPRNEEVPDRDRTARHVAGLPRRPAGVPLCRRDEDVVLPAVVQVEIRLLAGPRVAVERRVGRCGKTLRRRALHAGEHLVPHGVGPSADAAVADEELLLAAVGDRAGHRVGDEAATGVLRTGRAVVHQGEGAAGDLHPPHRCGLGDRPEFRGGPAALSADDVDRQVGQ